MTVTRRFAAFLTVALVVSVPALGCGSDDEGNAPNAAATVATANTDTAAPHRR